LIVGERPQRRRQLLEASARQAEAQPGRVLREFADEDAAAA
jgi:hypothetical protein